MPFAQLLPSKKVLWEHDRDAGKRKPREAGNMRKSQYIHVIRTVYTTHNPFSLVLLGLQWLGFVLEFHQNGTDRIWYSAFRKWIFS